MLLLFFPWTLPLTDPDPVLPFEETPRLQSLLYFSLISYHFIFDVSYIVQHTDGLKIDNFKSVRICVWEESNIFWF